MNKGLSEKQLAMLRLVIAVGFLCYAAYGSHTETISNLLLALGFVTAGFTVIVEGWEAFLKREFLPSFFLTVGGVAAFWLGKGKDACIAMIIFQLAQLFNMPPAPQIAHWQLDGQIIDIDPQSITKNMTLIYHKGERYLTDGITEDDVSVRKGAVNTTGKDIAVKVSETETSDKERTVIADNSNAEERMRRITGYICFGIVCMGLYILFRDGYKGACILAIAAFTLHVSVFFKAGINKLEKDNITVNDAAALEALGEETSVSFNDGIKLTANEYQIEEIKAEDEAELLKIMASIFASTRHPYGEAIIKRYDNDDLKIVKIMEESSEGIKAKVSTRNYYLGSYDYLVQEEVPVEEKVDGLAVHLSTKKKYLGYIRLSLLPSSETVSLFRQLHNAGIRNIYIRNSEGLNDELWQIQKFDERNRFTEIEIAETVKIGNHAEIKDNILNKIPSLFLTGKTVLRRINWYGIIMVIFKTALLYLIMIKDFNLWQVVAAESIVDALFNINKVN